MGQWKRQDVSQDASILFDGSAGREIDTWIKVEWQLKQHVTVFLKNKGVDGVGVAGTLYYYTTNEETASLARTSEKVNYLVPNSSITLTIGYEVNLFIQADILNVQAHILEMDSEVKGSAFDTM